MVETYFEKVARDGYAERLKVFGLLGDAKLNLGKPLRLAAA